MFIRANCRAYCLPPYPAECKKSDLGDTNRPLFHRDQKKRVLSLSQRERTRFLYDKTMTEIDGPSSVLLNASEEPALVAFDGLFEDPGLIELLDFTIDFDPARKADVGEVDAVGLGDAEQLVLELLDV